jgi:N-acetylmuramoyl-L-alanine amidase
MNAAKLIFYQALKRKNVIILVLGLFFFSSAIAQTPSKLGIKTVVIDPGHGGKDPGAVGPSKVQEKDVVLSVSLKIGALIKKKYPEIKVIYTRSTDEFIGLAERAQLANKNNADLFISIHCNAADNKSAHGFESWVLGLHKSEAALEIAKKENSAILMEDGHNQKYQDFDPNDADTYIGMTVRQNIHLEQSMLLANYIQRKCVNELKRNDRMVKQAGFMVLYRAAMPSILLELGFLSYAEEEKYLASTKGQDELSLKIFEAFEQYKEYFDRKNGVTSTITNGVNNDVKNQDKDTVKTSQTNSIVKPNAKNIVFKVQIATSATNLECKPENFKGLKNIQKTPQGNLFKYFVGDFNTFEEAKTNQEEVRKLGYDTAFIVAFENGIKIDTKVAIEKLKTN